MSFYWFGSTSPMMLTFALELFVLQCFYVESHGISDKTSQMYKRHYCGVSVHDFTGVLYNR